MKTWAVAVGLAVFSCVAWACSSSSTGAAGAPDAGSDAPDDASVTRDATSGDARVDAPPPLDAGGDANDAAACVSADWAMELATTDKTTHLEGTTVVDANGGVHTSCSQIGATGGLRYVHRAPGGGWSVEQAPITGAPNFNALALGPDGTIHLAYRDTASASLAIRYAERDTSGTWTPGVIYASGNPAYPSIVVTPSKRVHVAFQSGDGSTVGYEYRDPGGAWSSSDPFDKGALADNIALDVDGAGGLHVVYIDAFNKNVKYAHRPAQGTWSVEVVDAAGNGGTGGPRSLVVDAAGSVHLAYATSAGLMYAQRDANGWTKEFADATAGRGCEAVLVLDASGAAEIAYKHCTDPGVWFARRSAAGTWTTKLLDATGVYLGPATLAVEPSYRVHAVWKNGDANLVYGHARVCP